MDLTKKIMMLRQSAEEIKSYADLYDELIGSEPLSEAEASEKKAEAEFAINHMLKLSIHMKRLLIDVEQEESVK